MRHHDHRFEMSRRQFEAWAYRNCERFGYRVTFCGAGTIENAFSGQAHWRETFPEADTAKSFGFCSQAAVFTRCEAQGAQSPAVSLGSDLGFQHIVTHLYPYEERDGYPPTADALLRILIGMEMAFRPFFDQENPYAVDDEQTVRTTVRQLYQMSYPLARISRFNYDVFVARMSGLLNRVVPLEPESDLNEADLDLILGPQAEPIPKIKCLRILPEDDQIYIDFVFDVSSFRSPKHQLEAEISTALEEVIIASDSAALASLTK